MSHLAYFTASRVRWLESALFWARQETFLRKLGDDDSARLARASRMKALRRVKHANATLRAGITL